MQPLLSYSDWIRQTGRGQSAAFFNPTTASENRRFYDQYAQNWRTRFQQGSARALQENPDRFATPAEFAQQQSMQNFQTALNALESNRATFAGLGQPGDPSTQALINQEMEFGAAAAARAGNVARRQAAASGLGAGGGLNAAQRLIQEDLNRRNISAMRDIRSGLLAEGRAGTSRANELAAQAFFTQGFQLPESGVGAPSAGFNDFSFAFGPRPQTTPTATGGTQAPTGLTPGVGAPTRRSFTTQPSATRRRF
jgi:hypothetical protein